MFFRVFLLMVLMGFLNGCVTTNKTSTDGFVTNELMQAGVISKTATNQNTGAN